MNTLIRSTPRRLTALTGAAVLIASLTAAATSPAAAGPGRPAAASPNHPSRVVLPTGEQLSLRWDGDRPRIGRLPGNRSPLTIATAGNHLYAIPPEAMPYIGSAFDRSMFDVTALAAQQSTGRIPVSLTFAGAAVDVPGVRITARSGSHAAGYLTSDSAAAFGAALRDRLRSDPAGARQAGTPVAGLTHLALDAPGGGTVTPAFPQVTLTVQLVPPVGKTLLGASMSITNIDDSRKYASFVGFGPENVVKVSVPKGHYAFVGSVAVAAADGTLDAFYVPVVADHAVLADQQSVALDARKVSATASFSTPRPADVILAGMDVVPTDGVRPSYSGMGFSYTEERQVVVQPTPKPRHGVLRFDTYQHRSVRPAGASGVEYHLAAEWLEGIPASLHRTVRLAELARVEDRFFAGGAAGQRAMGRGAVFPDIGGVEDINPVSNAATLIDYLYGPPSVIWTADAYQDAKAGAATEGMFSAPVAYQAGKTYRVDWFRGSLAPGFAQLTFPQLVCFACRTPEGMSLTIYGETDADPNHHGYVAGQARGYSRLQVFRDGIPVADVRDADGVDFPVPTQLHKYRIVDTVDRAKLGFTTSTRMTTDYTVRSSATSGAPVPDDWFCIASDALGGCTVLPMITANVPLPTTQANRMPIGTSRFVVSIGHVLGATPSAITKLTFATSGDGRTYTPAKVRALGAGRYEVTLVTAPAAAGHPVSVRVHTEDAAGGALTQTVVNAYTVGTSPAQPAVFQPSCAAAEPGRMSCLSRFRATTVRPGNVPAAALPPGLSPADVTSAYGLAGAPAAHSVVAIVDAFDNPNAEADLGVYRAKFGLPACTTANGCFRKVNQAGATTPLPEGDMGWGLEISLDLDAISAACPTCRLLLVEADSPLFVDIGAAVDTAVRLGAKVVSNSYGAPESVVMADFAKHWKHAGVSIVVSSGDFGFTTASFPAVLASSIAVGGTTLTRATTTRGWKEKAWSGAGSGCSAYIAKPAWQHDRHCRMRTVADVSAVADPATGLAVYDTYLPPEFAGFLVAGGTSLAAPLIAAMIARSGHVIDNAGHIYAHRTALYDVVGGSTGFCGGDYLCTGRRGYDAPTGMGTPHGVAAL